MDGTVHTEDWWAGRIRDWHFLLLRFAITLDPQDESTVIAVADEIDALGRHWEKPAPSFFRRTTSEVCKAIVSVDDPRRKQILERHLAQIDDLRLRQALRAVLDLQESSSSTKSKRQGLWDGLPEA